MTCKAKTKAGHQCSHYARRDGFCDLHHPKKVEQRRKKAARDRDIKAVHELLNERRSAEGRIVLLRSAIADAVIEGRIADATMDAAAVRALQSAVDALGPKIQEAKAKVGWV